MGVKIALSKLNIKFVAVVHLPTIGAEYHYNGM
jgi:hypothetical protein